MNSECAVKFTEQWVDMVKSAGPQAWTTYTWYQAGSDFGAGKAAMLFDADILGYFQNQKGTGADNVVGNIGWAAGRSGQAVEDQHLDLVAGDECQLQEQRCDMAVLAVGNRQGLLANRRDQVRDG